MQAVQGCRYNCDPARPSTWCEDCAARPDHPAHALPVSVVDLPLGATEDRVVGALNLERALNRGERAFEPGLLARANRGFLYIDEVNLLEDHLVDLLIDVAASGENVVERLPRLWAPLLLMAGGGDRTVPPQQSAEVRDLVPGAELVTMPGLGHLAHEERPAEVAALSAWIASGRVLDLILLGMALESAALTLLLRLGGRGVPPGALWPNLLSGMCLLLAMRPGLAGAWWDWVSLPLLGALALYVARGPAARVAPASKGACFSLLREKEPG